MLQKTYSIYSGNVDNGQLFIEAGKNHLACWWREKDENRLTDFEFFQCDNYNARSFDKMIEAATLDSKLLNASVDTTQFILNTDETFGIPADGRKDEEFIKQNFDLLFGPCPAAKIFSEEYEQYFLPQELTAICRNVCSLLFTTCNSVYNMPVSCGH